MYIYIYVEDIDRCSIVFKQDEWTDRNGNSVSRQHFIVLLTDVKFVLIRAIFSSKTVASAYDILHRSFSLMFFFVCQLIAYCVISQDYVETT